MKTHAKTQPELAQELTARMGVNVSTRTVKRCIERARDAGWKGVCPPRPLPDGRLDIEGWVDYLRAIDYKAVESDEVLPDRPSGSEAAVKPKPLSEYVSHILRSSNESDRHERTVEALISMIDGMRKLSFPPSTKDKRGSRKPQRKTSAPSKGGSSYSHMLAGIHTKAADVLEYLDRSPIEDHEERAVELEALIFGAAADSIVLPDGRTVAEAVRELPEE